MRGPLAFLLLAGLLLAGCTGDDPGSQATTSSSTETAPPPPALPTTLAEPTLHPEVDLGPGAGEPNLAFAPDGTLYASDPGIDVWRSDDGGKTFKATGAKGIEGGGDGDIAVDGSGRLHWLGLFGGNGRAIPYQASGDRGETFSAPVDVSDGSGSDREWIDATPDGRIYAAWRDAAGYVFNASFDGGQTWHGKVVVGDDALGGPVVHDPSQAGRLYIPLVTLPPLGSTDEAAGAQIVVMRSEDDGADWEAHPVASARGGPGDPFFVTQIFPVAAVDDAGNLYLVVSVKSDTAPTLVPKPAAPYSVLLFVSTDQGTTWSPPTVLSTPLKAGIMPWVAAGAEGRVAIVWYESVAGAPNDAIPDLWNVELLEGLDMHKAPAERKTARIQLNDQPNHIGSVCTNGVLCVAGGDRSLLDFFEVAIGPNGQPAAVWAVSAAGTGIGVAAQGTDIHVRAVATGTPLR